MSRDLLALIEEWDGQGVVTRFDRPTGTRIFIALHDSTLGRPTGGSRMKVYPTPTDALRDAQRLAEGMTCKWAGLGLPYGGGKAVLAIPHPLEGKEREGLLLRYGAFLESLSGAFATGADLGAGPEDLATVARKSRFVLGIDPRDNSSRDPGPFTAHGVLCGMRSALRQVFGSDQPEGRSILIEGVGGVGAPLARALTSAGARVLLSDLDTVKADVLARELGTTTVPSDHVFTTPVDVYAPCAIGATLNHESIPQLACRIVAGSANNQLLEVSDAEALQERGILYVPDYILNAGGALAFARMQEGELEDDDLMVRVAAIGEAITAILEEAASSGTSPLIAARHRVDRLLAERRQAQGEDR